MPSRPINIDQYITLLRASIADSLALSNPDPDAPIRLDLMERMFAGDPSISLSMTQEQAASANAALDFASNAKNFLNAAGHPIAFQTFDESDAAEEGLGGLYRHKTASNSAAIRLPIELDQNGDCKIDAERGLKIASTLAHEIVHATDDFMRSQEPAPPSSNMVARINYNKSKHSYAALSFDNTLEEHFENVSTARTNWEEKISGIFKVDLQHPAYSDYKDSFITELAPRMTEAHFLGKDLVPQINALSPDNQALTRNAIDSFTHKLTALHDSAEFHDISVNNGNFLESFANITSEAGLRITPQILPKKLDVDELEKLLNDIDEGKSNNDASIDISDALKSIEAIDGIKKTVQDSNSKDKEAMEEPDAVSKSTDKTAKRHSISRY